MKINSDVLLVTLGLISSSFYTTRLGVSPVYVLSPLWVLLWLLIASKVRMSVSNNAINTSVIIILSVAVLMVLNIYNANNFTYPIIINYIVASSMLIATLVRPRYIKEIDIIRSSFYFNVFIISISIIDLLLRIKFPDTNPMLVEGSDVWFYKYKKSFLFGDTNLLAILLMTVLFFNLILKRLVSMSFMKFNLLLFILILFCLSRSAVVATLIGIFYYIIYDYRKFKVFIYLGASILSLFLMSYVIEIIQGDGSGATKVKELTMLIQFLELGDLSNIFLGLGFGHGKEFTGMYVHGLYVKLIVEGGVVFFMLFLMVIYSLRISFKCLSILIIPLMVSSLSLSFYIVGPFQFLIIGMLKVFYNSVNHRKLDINKIIKYEKSSDFN